jgi:hypothetical protein
VSIKGTAYMQKSYTVMQGCRCVENKPSVALLSPKSVWWCIRGYTLGAISESAAFLADPNCAQISPCTDFELLINSVEFGSDNEILCGDLPSLSRKLASKTSCSQELCIVVKPMLGIALLPQAFAFLMRICSKELCRRHLTHTKHTYVAITSRSRSPSIS